MVILDTGIIIDHLRQSPGKPTFFTELAQKYPKKELVISMITIQELYEGKSTKDEERQRMLLATIAPLRILPYTYEIAQLAGEIARDLKFPIGLADAAIAATTIINGCQLATLNKKDFSGISGLELL